MADEPIGLLELEACRVDLVRGWVERASGRITLTSRELALLRHFAAHPGQVVTRDELLSVVWGYSDAVVSRACDNSVYRLRGKIEVDPKAPTHLLTAHGEGYRFEYGHAPAPAPAPSAPARPTWSLGERQIELARLRVVGPDGEIPLTQQEADLLLRLYEARGAVVDQATLMREIWGQHTASRAVGSAIRRLRTKIEPDPSEPRYLLTERGGGFLLVVPQESAPQTPREAMVGREEELSLLQSALSSSRWVLVTGPGGMGKTRLVRQLAVGRACVWVDLAQADTEDEILQAVARALSVEIKEEPRTQLERALARRQGLLVLDNLEQVADEVAPLVRSWLQLAPNLGVLGTSRVRLGLPGEAVLELPPLPEDQAVSLFHQRARAAHPSLRIRPEQEPLVRALVQQLDGLPLALELAAARVGVLGLQMLLERLDKRLDVLSLPLADEPRHASLSIVLADSWDLLEPDEATALLLCARFRNGFALDDIEGLLADAGLDLLQSLRDHSLVHLRQDGQFGIYEPIRMFADERRAALPDGGRQLDLRWVRWMARLGDPALLKSLWWRGQEAQARRQRAAVEDLERASDVAVSWEEVDLTVRTLLGAAAVRRRQGPYTPMLARLERALQLPLSALDLTQLRLLRGDLLTLCDRHREAATVFEEALQQVPPDAHELQARLWSLLGWPSHRPWSVSGLERAAELFEVAGRPERAAYFRAHALMRQNDVEAYVVFEQAAASSQRVGDLELSARAMQWMGRFDEVNGRLGLASRRYREALETFQRADLLAVAADAGIQTLRLLALTGEVDQIDPVVATVLAITERGGDRLSEANCHMALAQVYLLGDRLVQVQEVLLRARQALSGCEPYPLNEAYLDLYEAELMLARQDLRSAEALCESARARFVSIQHGWGEHLADGLRARLWALQGRTEALALADQAVRATEPYPAYADAIFCLLWRGQVRARLGDREGASQDLVQGEALARDAGFVLPRSAPAIWASRLRALLST
jgi:DNA-binding response OmpR family regulator/tetratricopeptide (TPR) repeat protein